MKIFAMGIDPNGRSTADFVDVPLTKVSATEEISAKQPGTIWRIGNRKEASVPRTAKSYTSPSGPYEMHVGGAPHFIGCMSGNAEITMQEGMPWRLTAGDFLYVRPGALHHSNNASLVPVTIFNLYMPGTPASTEPLAIKQA